MGYYLSKVTFNTKHKYILYTLGLAGIVISVLGNIYISLESNKPCNRMLNDTCLHTFFIAMSIFILFKNLDFRLFLRHIDNIRNDLLGIYLIHPFILIFVDLPLIRNATNHVITIPCITIVVFILSLVSVKVLRSIPLICNYIR